MHSASSPCPQSSTEGDTAAAKARVACGTAGTKNEDEGCEGEKETWRGKWCFGVPLSPQGDQLLVTSLPSFHSLRPVPEDLACECSWGWFSGDNFSSLKYW